MRRDGLRDRGFDLLAELVPGLEVRLPANPPRNVLELMATLGVTVVEDATLPRPPSWDARRRQTRVDLSDEIREHQRAAYFARPAKPHEGQGTRRGTQSTP